MQIPIVGGAYESRSPNLDCARLVNLYPERDESGTGKAVAALFGTPGTRLLATLGGIGPVRALFKPSTGDAIAVQGSSVYRVSDLWAATYAGSLLTTSGPVSIADNGTTAVLVDGAYGYTLPLLSNTVTQITADAFYGADRVRYLDGYFIFNRPDTQMFYISGLGTTTFDALEFASAEGAPDLLVSIHVDHRELWLFGETSTEVFFNSGNIDFPFERTGNAFIQIGCAAAQSVASMDNTIYWIGKDERGQGAVWRANGYSPVRTSTHAVEKAIQSYETISDAIAYTYQQEGHSFYVLTFPTANRTWVYDAATQLWHERAYRESNGSLNRHRSNCYAFFGGEHVVGDWESGKLYALDLDYYSDNGDEMPAIRVTPHVSNPDYLRMIFDSLQIDMETGVGTQTGQGSNPHIIIEWSDDGGHTWSNRHPVSIGAVGRYSTRAIIRRMGMSRDRVFRLTITDPVKRAIVGASAKVRLCLS